MNTNDEARHIADQNVERLLAGAYRPEVPDPAFVQSVTAAMRAAAREQAAPRPPLRRSIVSRPITWTAAASLLLAAAAMALVYLAAGVGRDMAGRGAGVPRAEDGVGAVGAAPARTPQGAGETPAPQDAGQTLAPQAGKMMARPAAKAAPAERLAVGESLETAGQRRRVALDDGSVLYLNRHTAVKLDHSRDLTLRRGEVFVEVAPVGRASSVGQVSNLPTVGQVSNLPKRFTVHTPGRQVIALGTKFDVRVHNDATEVLVTQGKVQVTGMKLPLLAGQQLGFTGREESEAPVLSRSPRATHALDWTRELVAAAQSPLVPGSEHSGGALVAVDPNGQETKLSLRKYHVDVYIEDGFARTTIDQTYFNHQSWRMEGTFYFPLPPDASLSRLAMYVDGRLMEGGMAERDYARQVFESIVYRQKDPALLEWVDGSTFKMRVFPLEGRQEKRIVLSYTQRLPSPYGRMEYRFPGGHSLPEIGHWSAHVRVKGGAGVQWSSEIGGQSRDGRPSPLSPDKGLKPEASPKAKMGAVPFTASKDKADLVLDASAQKVKPDRDIVITLQSPTPNPQSPIPNPSQFSTATQDGATYLALRWRPHLPAEVKHERRDWVFLFESSGDRDPLLARCQIEIIRAILQSAEHDDTFAILTAGTRVHVAAARQEATAENVARAMESLDQTHLIGALDLERALAATGAYVMPAKNPVLVHVGSAVAILGERNVDALVRRIPERARYVGVGVGKRWDRTLMKTAAARTGGYFTQINPTDEVRWRATDLLATLNTPRLLGVRVNDKAEKLRFLTCEDSLAEGEELCAIAQFDAAQKLPESVEVSGMLDGELRRWTLPVTGAAPGAGYLPRTWARLEIDCLVAEGAEKHKARIIELSKAMYVMSPFTSLLVLENEQMYAQYKVDRGRKDHWALYPCPAKIPVVSEPLPLPAVEKPAVAEATRARTVGEILETITWRLPPPILTGNYASCDRNLLILTEVDDAVNNARRRMAHNPEFAIQTLQLEADKVTKLPGLNPDVRDQLIGRLETAEREANRRLTEIEARRQGMAENLAAAKERELVNQKLTRNRQLYAADLHGIATITDYRSVYTADLDIPFRWGGTNYMSAAGYNWWYDPNDPGDTSVTGWQIMALRDSRLNSLVFGNGGYGKHGRPDLSNSRFLIDALGRSDTDSNDDAALSALHFTSRLQNLEAGGNDDILLFKTRTRDGGFYYGLDMDRSDALMIQDRYRGVRRPVNVYPVADLVLSIQRPLIEPILAIGKHHIPMPDDLPIIYPDAEVWRELSERRRLRYSSEELPEATRAESPRRVPMEKKILDELKKPTDIDFVTARFKDVIQYLADYHDISIAVDGYTLKHSGFDPECEVRDVRYKGISLRSALRRFLSEHELTYIIRNETLLITTKEEAWQSALPYSTSGILERFHSIASARPPAYAPPRFSEAPAVFSDLLDYAPGMHTSAADVLAVLEAELPRSGDVSPANGEQTAKGGQDARAPRIDEAARRLIEKARGAGWQRATINDPSGKPLLIVDFDATGRCRYERTTAGGVREQVLCDGANLWHLYPELGVGARRVVSRFHRAQLGRLIPWSLPPVEDLARRADVSAIDPRTVAIVPILERGDSSPLSTAGTGASAEKQKAATIRRTPNAYLTVHLVFAPDGRLAERRYIEMPERKSLLVETYAADGTVELKPATGKPPVRWKIGLAPCGARDLKPDAKLVLVPLPLRNRNYLEKQPQDASEDDALAAVAVKPAGTDPSGTAEVLAKRFFQRGDRRLGLYTLLLRSGYKWNPKEKQNFADNLQMQIDPLADHPNEPLAKYVAASPACQQRGDPPQLPEKEFGPIGGPANGLLQELAEFHDLWIRWHDGRATQCDAARQRHQRQRTLDFVRRCRSIAQGWALLTAAGPENLTGQDRDLQRAYVEAVLRFKDVPWLSYFARYEHARALSKLGQWKEAQNVVEKLYNEGLDAGVLVPVDASFREAFQLRHGADSPQWQAIFRNGAAKLISAGRRVAAVSMAWQLLDLSEPALADDVLGMALRGAEEEERWPATLAALEFYWQSAQHARFDGLLRPLLEDKVSGRWASLWRLAAAAAEKRDMTARALTYLERALEIEYQRLPEKINVEVVRGQYGELLERYGKLAKAVATLGEEPPRELAARIIRAADRWRQLDPDPTAACQAAAKILSDLGAADLAWDYLTTPLASRPNEAAPWTNLAKALREQGHFMLADRAYASAFHAEPTNAQILWDRAQALLENGHGQEARKLFRQLSEGQWDPRFSGLKEQAKGMQ